MTDTYESRHAGRTTNELILPEGEYAYTRDKTSGVTSVRCGPTVINMQGSEEPVVYDQRTERFRTVDLQEAAQVNITVPTGHYAVMHNPSKDGQFPERGNKNVNKELLRGQRVHISGPASFALWPRQNAGVIPGHQLRSNQYLLVQVYDEEAARASWDAAVVKKAATDETGSQSVTTDETVVSSTVPEDLSNGRLYVIKGTEVSFYIPPTGVEVKRADNGDYVREALTLERLQYCILIDENGNKRYVKGPDVVFPKPTERFYANDAGDLIFRPVELNGSIQGLHIKVIAAYTDVKGEHGPEGMSYNEGDELFITGATTPIYFPCEQHSAIRYDGKTKHFATAIPSGDARYLLNRHTGVITMIEGGDQGTMSLPDPRESVFVRRVLTDSECTAMYPENMEALQFNQALRAIQANAPTTRKGVVSEGDLSRGLKSMTNRSATKGSLTLGGTEFAEASLAAFHSNAEMGGDEFSRKATYTEPRTVTLGNDKFAGVPKISPWTGYAVMVTDTAGNRRVEVGPGTVLLNFNETLEVLALSTGKPKNTDRLFKTAYLQVQHNKVSDIITVETSDHVTVKIKVSLRVNFEGDDPTKWFAVSNYVKLLCDHVRSVLKGSVRKARIEDFWANGESFVRNTILGENDGTGAGRPGMVFEENGMRVYDVEVLDVVLEDSKIQQLLAGAQHEAVEAGIELARNQRRLEAVRQREDIKRQELEARASTKKFESDLEVQEIARQLEVGLATIAANIERAAQEYEQSKAREAIKDVANTSQIARERAQADNNLEIQRLRDDLRINMLAKETQATVDQLKAVEAGFSEALLALGNQETLARVAEALSVQSFIGGKNAVEVIQKVFAGTDLEKLMTTVQTKALPNVTKGGNGVHA